MANRSKPSEELARIAREKAKEPAFSEDGSGVLTEFEEMPEAKVQVSKPGPRMYRAADGHTLPIFYKNSIIFIGDKPVEIDESALSYEARIQFEQALKLKQIEETGV